jgi:hypothetical protein
MAFSSCVLAFKQSKLGAPKELVAEKTIRAAVGMNFTKALKP